jgi:hypothetical protein
MIKATAAKGYAKVKSDPEKLADLRGNQRAGYAAMDPVKKAAKLARDSYNKKIRNARKKAEAEEQQMSEYCPICFAPELMSEAGPSGDKGDDDEDDL